MSRSDAIILLICILAVVLLGGHIETSIDTFNKLFEPTLQAHQENYVKVPY